MFYYRIGEWLIKEDHRTCWIYKKGTCHARVPVKKHKTVSELKEILEKFLIVLGEYYE